ncbi:MAG: glutaredoxin domain-containing protein [Vulcanimicrobiaceae bacterium]
MPLELYGSSACPYTTELREELDWREEPFIEYDVERDEPARLRLTELIASVASVPVLVRDGKVVQVGHRGRSCVVGTASDAQRL